MASYCDLKKMGIGRLGIIREQTQQLNLYKLYTYIALTFTLHTNSYIYTSQHIFLSGVDL